MSYIVKWKNYYYRALKGESFHIEEHFNYPVSNIIRYSRVTFEPLIGEDQKIFCRLLSIKRYLVA
jgi:hypothetical protein